MIKSSDQNFQEGQFQSEISFFKIEILLFDCYKNNIVHYILLRKLNINISFILNYYNSHLIQHNFIFFIFSNNSFRIENYIISLSKHIIEKNCMFQSKSFNIQLPNSSRGFNNHTSHSKFNIFLSKKKSERKNYFSNNQNDSTKRQKVAVQSTSRNKKGKLITSNKFLSLLKSYDRQPSCQSIRLHKQKQNLKPQQFLKSNIGAFAHSIKIDKLNLQQSSYRKSSKNKTQCYEEQESEDQQFCSIYIILQNSDVDISVKYKVKTIGNLTNFLKNYLKKHNHKKQIVAFQTSDYNLQMDYYLTLKNSSGQFLNGTSLTLKPIYKQVQQEVTLNSFQIIQCIGTGGFSQVFLCRFKQNGKFFAMKVIDKAFIIKNQKKKIVINQRNIMIQLSNHPFLSKLYFAFQSKSHLVFVMQYYEGGELFNLVKKFRKMNQKVAKFYIIQTLLGLEQIHKKNIVYRDFKPQNIMVDLQGHIHIADFGLAKPNISSKNDRAYSFCGSPEYMPPQMILKEGHSLPVDFYCLGAVLYQLVTGLPPFYDKDPQKIYEATISQKLYFPDHVNLSRQLQDLLTRLLCKDQRFRIGSLSGVKQVLAHPWFGKINKLNYIQRKVEPPVNFSYVQNLRFNIDEVGKQNQKYMREILKHQKLEANSKYLKVMNGFYYDSRQKTNQLQERPSSSRNQKRNSISKNQKQKIQSKYSNKKNSSLMTDTTRRSTTSLNKAKLGKQRFLSNKSKDQKEETGSKNKYLEIGSISRKLFGNLNNFL